MSTRVAGWRLRALASEAGHNVAAGGGRTLAVVALVAIGMAAAGWWEGVSVASARATEAALVLEGTSTVRLLPADGQPGLDASACLALDHRAGIVAAGPVWAREGVRTPATGERRRTTITASDGAVAALTGGDRVEADVRAVVAVALAEELALGAGDELAVLQGDGATPLPVGAVAELGRRRPDLDAAVLGLGVLPTPASECWVSLDPSVDRSVLLALAGSFPGEAAPQASLVVPPDGLLRSPRAELRRRPSRFGGALAGVLVAVAWSALLWGRRREVGLYRSFGVTRLGAIGLAWCELALTVGAGTAVAAMSGVGLFSTVGGAFAAWAVGQAAIAVAAALAGGLLGSVLLTRASAADLLGE